MSVITKTIEIGQIPAIIWGSPAPKSYFYVHGQEGCKEEAAILANICKQPLFADSRAVFPGQSRPY